jgi:hypothetical protein
MGEVLYKSSVFAKLQPRLLLTTYMHMLIHVVIIGLLRWCKGVCADQNVR